MFCGTGRLEEENGKRVYTGEWYNGKRHGSGVQQGGEADWPDELRFEGLFKNDLRHGDGEQEMENGDKYVGQFKHDSRCGKGELSKRSTKYVGEMKDNKPNGTGRLEFQNGDFYEGEFVAGAFHGKGTLVSQAQQTVYVGEFEGGSRHGLGVEEPLAAWQERERERREAGRLQRLRQRRKSGEAPAPGRWEHDRLVVPGALAVDEGAASHSSSERSTSPIGFLTSKFGRSSK